MSDKWEVGDAVVYFRGGWFFGEQIVNVESVTPTGFAKVGGKLFDRKDGQSMVYMRGNNHRNLSWIRPATDADRLEHAKRVERATIAKVLSMIGERLDSVDKYETLYAVEKKLGEVVKLIEGEE